MTTYLLNTPIITDYGDWRFSGPLALEQARALLDDGFESAIGHAGAVAYLSGLLDVPIDVNVRKVNLHPGDRALVVRYLGDRLSGRSEQGADGPYELGVLTRLR